MKADCRVIAPSGAPVVVLGPCPITDEGGIFAWSPTADPLPLVADALLRYARAAPGLYTIQTFLGGEWMEAAQISFCR